ncbi:sulfite exporter TauE/SafE family protein [Anaerobacillus sp. MEB173]|uniref:sulfite exporter TauE/SafE family protein n=1 Tax=Anaerobacillus sp. MEB173 TaxID=3383345 RepID=UPI003F90D3D9
MLITMFVIGLISGMITGLLSVGGGIILIFALIFIPPLVAQTYFPMQTIAGFSIMQAFFATFSGAIYYFREKLIDKGVVIYLGIPAFFGGIVGVIIAHNTSDMFLRIVFAVMAMLAAIVMQLPNKTNEDKPYEFTKKSYVYSIIGGITIGIVGGLIGLGAGFIFVPVMIYFYHLNVKKAIGSSLITCFLLATGSLLTKLAFIESTSIQLGIAIIVGGIIGAQLGGRLGKRLSPVMLKRIAAYSILIISIKVVFDLF